MKTVRRVSSFPIRFGGVEHSGWLPPGAAKPLPMPIEDAILDLEIMFDGTGYLLCWSSGDGKHVGDLWFETVKDAEAQACRDFGVSPSQWQISGSDTGTDA